MTGLQGTDLRELAKVRRRIESLDAQLVLARAQRTALLRSLRESGTTLAQIAAHVGVTPQAVHQWDRPSKP